MSLLIGVFLSLNPGLLLGVGSKPTFCKSSFGVFCDDSAAGVLLDELIGGVLRAQKSKLLLRVLEAAWILEDLRLSPELETGRSTTS